MQADSKADNECVENKYNQNASKYNHVEISCKKISLDYLAERKKGTATHRPHIHLSPVIFHSHSLQLLKIKRTLNLAAEFLVRTMLPAKFLVIELEKGCCHVGIEK